MRRSSDGAERERAADWTLRKAVPADRERIGELFLAMLRSVCRTEDVQGYEEGYPDRFFDGGEDWICVAQGRDGVLAYLSIEVHRETEDRLYLDDLSVAAPYRGAGIGTALLRRAEDYARELGVPAVMLHVERTNAGALRLYERLGYRALRGEGSRLLMGKTVF